MHGTTPVNGYRITGAWAASAFLMRITESLGRGDLVTNSFLAHLSAVKPSFKKSSKMTTPTVLVAIDRSM